ncbi:MAG: tRNA (adenosine(37)-N6)-threonylcarbamoyltransferase complex dimerization subunit type 1 TsaB [Vicinamibacterales bacterium]
MREYNIARMVILVLDTTTRGGSIGLWDHGLVHARAGEPSPTQAERLPGEVVSWLALHGRVLADVDLFAVVSGPGSFTGIRVGMAAVQGLAMAARRRALGIPALDALATTWLNNATEPALLVPCVDAQRHEVFFAAFDTDGADIIESCRPLIPPGVATPAELAQQVLAQAGGRQVVFVGDGAVRHADVLTTALPGAEVRPAPCPLAEAAAVIAHRRESHAGAPHALRPIYIRRPDAELARDRAGARSARVVLPFTIARASATDVPAVEQLQRQTFTNPWGAEAIRWELEHTDVARLYVMRTRAGALVGYCACWLVFDELHINSLAIDPALRRQGLARHLLQHVIAAAVTDGAASATLEVRSSNSMARNLYEGLGFHVEGVRRDYYQQPREDALILWKRGLP